MKLVDAVYFSGRFCILKLLKRYMRNLAVWRLHRLILVTVGVTDTVYLSGQFAILVNHPFAKKKHHILCSTAAFLESSIVRRRSTLTSKDIYVRTIVPVQ